MTGIEAGSTTGMRTSNGFIANTEAIPNRHFLLTFYLLSSALLRMRFELASKRIRIQFEADSAPIRTAVHYRAKKVRYSCADRVRLVTKRNLFFRPPDKYRTIFRRTPDNHRTIVHRPFFCDL